MRRNHEGSKKIEPRISDKLKNSFSICAEMISMRREKRAPKSDENIATRRIIWSKKKRRFSFLLRTILFDGILGLHNDY